MRRIVKFLLITVVLAAACTGGVLAFRAYKIGQVEKLSERYARGKKRCQDPFNKGPDTLINPERIQSGALKKKDSAAIVTLEELNAALDLRSMTEPEKR